MGFNAEFGVWSCQRSSLCVIRGDIHNRSFVPLHTVANIWQNRNETKPMYSNRKFSFDPIPACDRSGAASAADKRHLWRKAYKPRKHVLFEQKLQWQYFAECIYIIIYIYIFYLHKKYLNVFKHYFIKKQAHLPSFIPFHIHIEASKNPSPLELENSA